MNAIYAALPFWILGLLILLWLDRLFSRQRARGVSSEWVGIGLVLGFVLLIGGCIVALIVFLFSA